MKRFNKSGLAMAVAVAISGFQGVVFADDDDNDVPSIMQVNSSVNQVNSSVNKVKSAVDTVNNSVQQVGQGMSDNFKSQNELLGKLQENLIKTQHDQMVQNEIANARRRALEIYGDQGTDTSCTEGPAQAFRVGRTQMRSTYSSSGGSMEARSRSGNATKGSSKQVDDIMQVKEEDIKLSDIYPANGALTAAQKEKVQLVNERIIDPFPPNQMASTLKTTTNGKRHEATRLIYEMTKTAPRSAEATILSMKTADFPVNEWATGAWKDMGNSGTPDGVTEGKMSYDSFIKLFVRSRIDNDNWYKKATGAGAGGEGGNDIWQLRQINLNTAMALEIQYRQLEVMKGVLELLTQARANDIDKQYLPQLDDLLHRAESQQ